MKESDDICPACKTDLSYAIEGKDGMFSKIIGYEVEGVYDGVLIWIYPCCDYAEPRFSGGHRRDKAREIIREWEEEREKETSGRSE